LRYTRKTGLKRILTVLSTSRSTDPLRAKESFY
jgi:hypothetical protein